MDSVHPQSKLAMPRRMPIRAPGRAVVGSREEVSVDRQLANKKQQTKEIKGPHTYKGEARTPRGL